MDDSKAVFEYFQKRAVSFDVFYSKKKPWHLKILDFLFRRSMATRLSRAIKECAGEQYAEILDIGCGSGRSSVEAAKTGNKRITGIDFCPAMIQQAQKLSRQEKQEAKCAFVLGDFCTIDLNKTFDLSLALGFFDYTRNPRPLLNKIKQLTADKLVASFPAKWRLRNFVRKIRLKILSCPVYFYTSKQIIGLMEDSGFRECKIINLGRDYLVIACS